MALIQSSVRLQMIVATGIKIGIVGACLALEGINPPKGLSTPAMLEFRWEQDANYKKLYYYQSSDQKRARSTYYLVMKPKTRKTAILKLTINFPEHFDSNIKPKKLSLCRISVGGMLEKTRCEEKIPAVFEVTKGEKTSIDVFPNQPIPVSKEGYAVVMKIFNPSKVGMFQVNALTQSPGDMPISRYIGSWNLDIR
ncbi:DUF2808 domain-containing protein [Prochlorococcus sp. MIT 1307]|uniref:DUF2808 domain-containing protein n=1 Tax=Prochlorococcus sp. MIT 1307 TaxID=3096219 RepID=UPI002A75C89A|nr:DUF2808 domain-containing protein [Prochlorococcus sp. MIT 1307]